MLSYKTYMYNERDEAFAVVTNLKEESPDANVSAEILRPELRGASPSVWVVTLRTDTNVYLWDGESFSERDLLLHYLQAL